MTLSDLRSGMIVELRRGTRYVVLLNSNSGDIILAGSDEIPNLSSGWICCDDTYKDDLTCTSVLEDLDIMKVWDSMPHKLGVSYNLLWEREEVREVTLKEIERKFGCKIKIVDNKEEE